MLAFLATPVRRTPPPSPVVSLETSITFLDKLKATALIATFIGVLTIFAVWVSLWENVWRMSVEPC
jgi:hypothetical protein